MAYVLGNDIGSLGTMDGLERQRQKWLEYRDYLESMRTRMPKSAFEFATAPWHYDPADRRALHDSWVDFLTIREPASGARREIRSLEIEIRLLGPWHDGITTLKYRNVVAYSLNTPAEFVSPPRDVGHGDWLVDEVGLSERGHILHQVEFSGGGRWVIECGDIEWAYTPQQ